MRGAFDGFGSPGPHRGRADPQLRPRHRNHAVPRPPRLATVSLAGNNRITTSRHGRFRGRRVPASLWAVWDAILARAARRSVAVREESLRLAVGVRTVRRSQNAQRRDELRGVPDATSAGIHQSHTRTVGQWDVGEFRPGKVAAQVIRSPLDCSGDHLTALPFRINWVPCHAPCLERRKPNDGTKGHPLEASRDQKQAPAPSRRRPSRSPAPKSVMPDLLSPSISSESESTCASPTMCPSSCMTMARL